MPVIFLVNTFLGKNHFSYVYIGVGIFFYNHVPQCMPFYGLQYELLDFDQFGAHLSFFWAHKGMNGPYHVH